MVVNYVTYLNETKFIDKREALINFRVILR